MDRLTSQRFPLLGIRVNGIELPEATDLVIESAYSERPLGVSALAVHGLVTAVQDPELRYRLNNLELVVPDGQPLRWALNALHGAALNERVMGPELMSSCIARASAEELPIYLYGSRAETLSRLLSRLHARHPNLRVAGSQPSRFRSASAAETADDVKSIRDSGAKLVFVGLGCPRQEIWVYENRNELSMPALAVGAAFDYHAGLLERAPAWMGRSGLEWAYRLAQDPARLWRRYASTNPRFVVGVAQQFFGKQFDERGLEPSAPVRPG